MVWPPQSPDLNPIELLWDELERRIRKSMDSKRNREELWKCLKKNWDSLDSEVLNKLVARMPRICKAVIQSKGCFFDESKI